MDFDDLNIPAFEEFVKKTQLENKDVTTKGMFAPWILYKEDFQSIGGHDPLFAPFPYEDSDIFQRWILAGYELIQSRDSFVYHLTCRGHRWNEQVQKDDDYYKIASKKAARNYLRKWGIWIENDSYQYPIITPKYNVEFRVFNCRTELLTLLEPWCDSIYVDLYESMIDNYIKKEQPNTLINLSDKINKTFDSDIIVRMDGNTLTDNDFKLIQQLPKIIQDSGEIGKFNIGNLEITINSMNEYQNNLINVT
jgi:predicted transport protein